MKSTIGWALVLLASGCSPDGRSPDSVDAPSASSQPIAQLDYSARLAIAGDCLVATQTQKIWCVPLADPGAKHVLATKTDGSYVRAIGDAAGLVVVSLPSAFGPGNENTELDAVSFDGQTKTLATTYGGDGVGEGIALVNDRVVFTTGGTAYLLAAPRAGGTTSTLADDGGNLGDLAVIGSTAYYVNTIGVYTHDLNGPQAYPGDDKLLAGIDAIELHLASDGTFVVAAGPAFAGGTTVSIVAPTGAPTVAPIPGATSAAPAISAANGRAWLAVGADIDQIDLATGMVSTAVSGANAIDLIASSSALYWITQQGDLWTAAHS
jgi:hypothetical protein